MQVDEEDGLWGVLLIADTERQINLNSPEDGLIHLAWEARMFSLFCELTTRQTVETTRRVQDGMSRMELLAAMGDLVSGREIVHQLQDEVSDLPGLASLIAALDQLERSIRDKGLWWS